MNLFEFLKQNRRIKVDIGCDPVGIKVEVWDSLFLNVLFVFVLSDEEIAASELTLEEMIVVKLQNHFDKK